MQGDKRARRMAKQVAASADRRNHRADVADFLVPGDRRGSGAAHRIVAALDAHDPEMGREHVAKLAIGLGIASAAMNAEQRLAAPRFVINEVYAVCLRAHRFGATSRTPEDAREGERGG